MVGSKSCWNLLKGLSSFWCRCAYHRADLLLDLAGFVVAECIDAIVAPKCLSRYVLLRFTKT
ncbi:unnamed protein product [Ixodes pacificus]